MTLGEVPFLINREESVNVRFSSRKQNLMVADPNIVFSVDQIKFELKIAQKDYASAKAQATFLDEKFGYQCLRIENKLLEDHQNTRNKGQQFWYGLDLQSLQTPYSEIVEMIDHLKPQSGDLWLDLGAGYGRIGMVLGLLQPDVRFIGYEYVSLRVQEGNRIYKKWNIPSAELIQVDLADDCFEIDEADLYFIYDFGSRKDIYKVLEKLRLIAQKRSIRVIGRGRGVKNWILMDFPWLEPQAAPEHFVNWTLFRS